MKKQLLLEEKVWLAALEKKASGTRSPQNGGKKGGKGVGGSLFFSFSIENKKENGKNILYIL